MGPKRLLSIGVSALLLVLTTGCLQTTLEPSPTRLPALIRVAQPQRAWRVRQGAKTLGTVVYFQSESDPSSAFYSVRNPWNQELGIIDSLGMAWRYLPHEEDAQHVTTGTLVEGAAAVLEGSARCRLEPIDIEGLPGVVLDENGPLAQGVSQGN